MTPLPTADRLRRFVDKTIPEPNSGCLIWIGGSNEHGYGVFWNGARLEKAHRFALRVFGGVDLPDDLDVLHKCDTPCCVNHQHLRADTTQANVDDMWAKARATVLKRRGTAQAQAKLSDDKVVCIRALWATGRYTQRQLARIFDVSQRLVWNVIHDINWFAPSGVVVVEGCGR